MKNWIFLLAWTVIPFSITAQEDLSGDRSFFRDQALVYQRWLEHSGLGELIKVHIVELDTEGVDTLSLYLAFHADDTDFIINAWEQLKRDFESRSPLTLEQQLFYKMIHLMEIDQRQGNVQLFDTYDLSETPCFFVGVQYSDNDLEVVESICRSEIREIDIPVSNLSGLKDPAESAIQNEEKNSRRQIFESILDFVERRFMIDSKEGENECLTKAEIRVWENGQRLHLEASNLCRHVLYDETNSLLCYICDRLAICKCSAIKRELLSFLFTLEERPDADGFKLTCEIDGKYSDSWFSNKRGAYKPMEGEFDEYLELFATAFAGELMNLFE